MKKLNYLWLTWQTDVRYNFWLVEVFQFWIISVFSAPLESIVVTLKMHCSHYNLEFTKRFLKYIFSVPKQIMYRTNLCVRWRSRALAWWRIIGICMELNSSQWWWCGSIVLGFILLLKTNLNWTSGTQHTKYWNYFWLQWYGKCN